MEQSQMINVNGVMMTLKDFKRQKNKAQKAKKAKREMSVIRLLPKEINFLMKNVKVIKSLGAYYDNGKRQWGKICNDNVIKHKFIETNFLSFRLRSRELMSIAQDIEKISKGNEKAVFQYVQKFAWKLEDVQNTMEQLCKSVQKSRVCEDFKDYEFINGTQRRLGLKILMERSKKALNELYRIIGQLNDISVNGVDAFSYKLENSKFNDVA
jgi:hypothetical protein